MAIITFRKVKENANDNNTFLQCYVGDIVKLVEYKSGRIDLHYKNGIMKYCDGFYSSEYNGWNYTLKKILSRKRFWKNGGVLICGRKISPLWARCAGLAG